MGFPFILVFSLHNMTRCVQVHPCPGRAFAPEASGLDRQEGET